MQRGSDVQRTPERCTTYSICKGCLQVKGRCDCRNGAEKLLGVLITVGQAVAYVVAGMYGDVRDLGAGNAILIVLQVRLDRAVF